MNCWGFRISTCSADFSRKNSAVWVLSICSGQSCCVWNMCAGEKYTHDQVLLALRRISAHCESPICVYTNTQMCVLERTRDKDLFCIVVVVGLCGEWGHEANWYARSTILVEFVGGSGRSAEVTGQRNIQKACYEWANGEQ